MSPPSTRPTLVTAALLIGTFLASLDVNVVGTSMPTVVARLGGVNLYGWVFVAYLLTSTTTVPLYGRMADLYGRKPLYTAAALLFMAGSFLCGLAPSMVWLILFRALQGLGAGGLIPLTLTLFGDMYDADRRAVVQGIFSVVWGVSSVLGPLLGGFLVTYASWRWVFWINIPLGVLSVGLLWLSLHEKVERAAGGRTLNLGAAGLVIVGLSALLAGLQLVGQRGADPVGIALLAVGLGTVPLFVTLERRSDRPMFPAEIFAHRAARVGYLGGLSLGGVLFPLGAYVPLHIQGVLHGTPTQGGLALVPMTVSWTATTFFIARLARRFGYRPVVLAGGLALAAGTALLVALSSVDAIGAFHPAMLLVGAGMGMTITPLTIAVQDIMPWNRRAVATSPLQFPRTIGGTITVTVLGLVITGRFAAGLPHEAVTFGQPSELLDPAAWDRFPPDLLHQAGAALASGLRLAFVLLAVVATLALVTLLFFPRLALKEGKKGRVPGRDRRERQ